MSRSKGGEEKVVKTDLSGHWLKRVLAIPDKLGFLGPKKPFISFLTSRRTIPMILGALENYRSQVSKRIARQIFWSLQRNEPTQNVTPPISEIIPQNRNREFISFLPFRKAIPMILGALEG